MSNRALRGEASERAVLGAILKQPNIYILNERRIFADLFTDEMHKAVLSAIKGLVDNNRPVTLPAVANRIGEIIKLGMDRETYLASLIVDAASSTESLEQDLDDLRAMYNGRYIIEMCKAQIAETLKNDGRSTAERVETAFKKLRSVGTSGYDFDNRAPIGRALTQIQDAYQQKKPVGLPWFIKEVGWSTGGPIEEGNLVGIVSDSGGGKTSIALQQILFTASQGTPALFLSGEQSEEQCFKQMAVQQLKTVSTRDLREGKVSDHEFDQIISAMKRIEKMPIAIHRFRRAKLADLISVVRAFRLKHGNKPFLVICDHAKKIIPDKEDHGLSQQVMQIFGGFKDALSGMGCYGIMLMQRNGEHFKRNNPRPIRGDCYGGEGTLQNLDSCCAVFREATFLQEKKNQLVGEEKKAEYESRINECKDKAELYSLKNRFDEAGGDPVKIRFIGRFTRFESYDERQIKQLSLVA